ncbi:NDR1/HIN1-like protein 26 [Nymphaea colorata]|nr:NDR1/HIN1-like protein 26 [Nymphaea colorata]
MSDYFITSPKPCSSKQINHKKLFKRLSLFFSLIFSTVMIVLLIWYAVHPSKPQFSLQDAVIYQMNLSSEHLLTSAMQVTLVSKNPNQRIGIYYDKLGAYASYKGQQITMQSFFPPFYQGHEDVNVLSSWLAGNLVPVSPSFAYDMGTDQPAGGFLLNVKLAGRVRWKVATWTSGHYNLEVKCEAFMAYTKYSASGSPVSLMPGSQCHSSV